MLSDSFCKIRLSEKLTPDGRTDGRRMTNDGQFGIRKAPLPFNYPLKRVRVETLSDSYFFLQPTLVKMRESQTFRK